MTSTSDEDGAASLSVHYNVLDGSLLVNGSPLSRLPREYESHPTFKRLFKTQIVYVVPSKTSDMVFEARENLHQCQVYFRMHESELIIRAKREGRLYELLPLHSLHGDFPQAFVNNYYHWLELKTGLIEWRPLLDPWTPSSQNWQMFTSNHEETSLSCGSLKLIDVHSSTAKMLSAVLSPLEIPEHIQIMYNYQTENLEIHLGRLKLDFFMLRGACQLELKQYRDMCLDTNQSLGTLTGLANKLVLRSVNGSSRAVIIPEGKIVSEIQESHVRVKIILSDEQFSYYVYNIDSLIGRLIDDNGSLKSRLFICYLHAVTAHCLPDDLTGRTGTEEALSVLDSSFVRSFPTLDQTEIDLLIQLGRLTPHRKFYPDYLQVMQEVQWNPLHSLSQHPSFCTLVTSIFDRYQEVKVFSENRVELPYHKLCREDLLLQRAAIRDSSYRIYGFGAEAHTVKYDVLYTARDQESSRRESQVCQIARLVDSWAARLDNRVTLLEFIESLKMPLKGALPNAALSLEYDSKWLDLPESYLSEHWCAIHNTLCQSVVEKDKYKIMMFLSTLTFSQHWEPELVQTLLAFATVPKLRSITIPYSSSFDLSQGYEPCKQKLKDAIRGDYREYHHCPES